MYVNKVVVRNINQVRSWFSRASEWGYVLQDAAEYNVQTKVGMAMLNGY